MSSRFDQFLQHVTDPSQLDSSAPVNLWSADALPALPTRVRDDLETIVENLRQMLADYEVLAKRCEPKR